ncbi:unnamed protein product [Spirodela intermedia]|uniref:Uncharacterized protein n=1 Tax=Spirodela intermedia TaxID=51605 RepID=A0A7I8IA61_SPIIN|nr:unnamed protein product [Spirodela intermedia]CAA6654418.1 unnamed protein product [Spirodela intermedia]
MAVGVRLPRRTRRQSLPTRRAAAASTASTGGIRGGDRIPDGEIRRLVGDNRRLVDNCAGLQRELAMAKDEIHRLNIFIGDIRADKDAQIRDLIEKLRADLQKLKSLRQEQVQGLTQELSRSQADAKQAHALKGEIDGLRQELMRVRTALEYEKKGNAELVDQRQAMEKNLVSMARELEKLRAELASGEPRNWGAGGAYGVKLNSPEGGFPPFGDGYGLHSGAADKGPLYGMGQGSWGGYEKPRLPRR